MQLKGFIQKKAIALFGEGNQNHHPFHLFNKTLPWAQLKLSITQEAPSSFHSYPRVPRPDMGGLGGFCVGGFVLDKVPVLAGWLFPC